VKPGRYVLVAVTDTGTGMTAEVIERAFEPFFTTKEVGRGSGLGLSMVFGFVKQSGGHINIYSEVGHGTTVRMYFPKSDEAAAGSEPAVSERHEAASRNAIILVVEDDADVRAMADQMLSSLGYRVLQAMDGVTALATLEATPEIDLILTDVVLPRGMRGTDVAREARQRRPQIKILYMSGYTENAIIHQGIVDEGVELLSKPFRKAELARRIRKILDGG
jgi:CheY-like chemotaxis protein